MVAFVDDNNPYIADVLGKLPQISKIHTYKGRELNNQDLISNNCELLFARSTTQIDESLLKGTKVHYVATVTSGIDHLDTNYLYENYIYFASALGSNANGVAEFVLLSVFDWLISNNIDITHLSNYKKLKIGIIGFGNVGKKVGFYLHKLGCEIYVNDPILKEVNYQFPNYVTYLELDDILKHCDIITNHVPLTNKDESKYPTFNLLNKSNLNLLKQNNCFIHSSRGGVVNEYDILEISKNKDISLYFDVWENEPSINSNLKDVCKIATPHIAGHTINSKLNGVKMILRNFDRYLEQKEIINPYQTKSYEILERLISANDKMPQEFNFSEMNFELKLTRDKIYNIYHSLQKNRNFEEITKNVKQNSNLDVYTNINFDQIRKDYKSIESICF